MSETPAILNSQWALVTSQTWFDACQLVTSEWDILTFDWIKMRSEGRHHHFPQIYLDYKFQIWKLARIDK